MNSGSKSYSHKKYKCNESDDMTTCVLIADLLMPMTAAAASPARPQQQPKSSSSSSTAAAAVASMPQILNDDLQLSESDSSSDDSDL